MVSTRPNRKMSRRWSSCWRQKGPNLGFPHSSKVRSSQYGQMRELRIQHRGEPYRVLYAFDPRRVALLLVGGCKSGDDRWYDKYVPLADRLLAEHLEGLEKERGV